MQADFSMVLVVVFLVCDIQSFFKGMLGASDMDISELIQGVEDENDNNGMVTMGEDMEGFSVKRDIYKGFLAVRMNAYTS